MVDLSQAISETRREKERNVLDQNVNGKEVKRVIYFLIASKAKSAKRQRKQKKNE